MTCSFAEEVEVDIPRLQSELAAKADEVRSCAGLGGRGAFWFLTVFYGKKLLTHLNSGSY